jgi:hypothetical protein
VAEAGVKSKQVGYSATANLGNPEMDAALKHECQKFQIDDFYVVIGETFQTGQISNSSAANR